MDIAINQQVKYVACKLKGGVRARWIQLNLSRQQEGKGYLKS